MRRIPGLTDFDAMGCYPRFFCRDWTLLQDDLEETGSNLICLAVVTEPFGSYDIDHLLRCFKDVVKPYKEHYIVDLSRPLHEIVSRNRRKKAQRALNQLSIELCPEPAHMVEEWVSLYRNLIMKHRITGIRKLSVEAFAKQLSIPGIVMFRATHRGVTVGATLWFVQGDVAYGHLAAFSDTGYDLMASYALDWYSIRYFADSLRWLDFGAGVTNGGNDGLSLYKRGWATGTRTAYLCGRIFNRVRYEEIAEKKGLGSVNYFPAYRKGEFD